MTSDTALPVDLEPCPFCGSAARLTTDTFEHWVECSKVGVCIANGALKHGGSNFREDAVRLWNTRATTRTAVKPLEWTKHPTAEAWRCDTILGTYQVWVGSIGTGWQFEGLMDRLDTPAAGAEAAKAAAQVHFNSLAAGLFELTSTTEGE